MYIYIYIYIYYIYIHISFLQQWEMTLKPPALLSSDSSLIPFMAMPAVNMSQCWELSQLKRTRPPPDGGSRPDAELLPHLTRSYNVVWHPYRAEPICVQML